MEMSAQQPRLVKTSRPEYSHKTAHTALT